MKRISKAISFVSICTILMAVLVGCSMDAPKDGVQIKVATELTDTQLESLKKTLKSYDSGITSTGHMKINSDLTINLSPIADVQAFADKIECGKVTDVTDRVITVTVDTSKL